MGEDERSESCNAARLLFYTAPYERMAIPGRHRSGRRMLRRSTATGRMCLKQSCPFSVPVREAPIFPRWNLFAPERDGWISGIGMPPGAAPTGAFTGMEIPALTSSVLSAPIWIRNTSFWCLLLPRSTPALNGKAWLTSSSIFFWLLPSIILCGKPGALPLPRPIQPGSDDFGDG